MREEVGGMKSEVRNLKGSRKSEVGRACISDLLLLASDFGFLAINEVGEQSIAQFGLKPGAFGGHYITAVGNIK